MKYPNRILPLLAATAGLSSANPTAPIAPAGLVFAEQDGLVAFEAEHFAQQDLAGTRAWYITHPHQHPRVAPDTDGIHVVGASGGAYLEILPDTRWTHDEKLVVGENFSNEPGKLAVLTYRVHFATPGRYHVWARILSTGGEDNGMHFGPDGEWSESGRRWQTTKKHAWAWDSRQRTEQVHVGVPGQLWLDVLSAGEHRIQISMREDGFELDKIVLALDPKFVPEDAGPEPRVLKGSLSLPFPVGENYQEAPAITPLPPTTPPSWSCATYHRLRLLTV